MIDDVAVHLAENTNLVIGKTLFKGNAPQSPADCVILYDTGGGTPEQELPADLPSVQVICRAKANNNGRTRAKDRAQEIFNLLNRKIQITIGSKDVMYSRAVASPQSLGVNEEGRWEYVINFTFKTRESC